MVGRTCDEFLDVIQYATEYFELYKDVRLVIYIHNLSFEFQAFRKLFSWSKVFALKERKPLQCITTEGIEFRCSYLLSGYSLNSLGRNLTKYNVKKLTGELDYDLPRSPITPLTENEINYCLNDVYVVMAYIQETMDRMGNITKIPLTKTGYVRKYCRDSCLYVDKSHREGLEKYRYYRNLMKSLTMTKEEYKMLKEAFQGGFTHANPYFSRGIFKDVKSYDFTSSYPAVMIAEKFPMSKGEWFAVKSEKDLKDSLNYYCCVFDVKFDNISPKVDYENYISVSHCRNLIGEKTNNGRIVKADHLETTITELDFQIIVSCYEWDSMKVGGMIRYKKDYLPTDFVKAILKLYVDKTKLKGVKGEEINYLLAKEQLNSCYGMCVTDVCRDEITYEKNEWGKEEVIVNDNIEKYNKSVKRFLSYAWGVWVTAYARVNLFTGIHAFKDDYIYSDTDSLKVINYEEHQNYIDWYNKNIIRKLETACRYHGINIEDIAPKNKFGEKKPLGVWTDEGVYSRFKTLGAKRYITEMNGEISLTVAGLGKKEAIKYMKEKFGDDIFKAFDVGLYIPAGHTGKLTHTYIDNAVDGIMVDHKLCRYHFHEESGTHLEPADYDLSLSREYLDFLMGVQLEDGY